MASLIKLFCFLHIIKCQSSKLLNSTKLITSLNLSFTQTTEFTSSYSQGPSYTIRGYEPSLSGSYPLFIWLAGTSMSSWGTDAQIYTNNMASNNVVGASVYYANNNYPTSCTTFRSRAQLIFNNQSSTSAISVLCARTKVNCDLGVIVAGFSQGAQLGSMSANYAGNLITAVYEMGGGDRVSGGNNFALCLGINSLSLASNQIRSCVGEFDEYFGTDRSGVRTQQIAITGYDHCGAFATDCIQSDGSGWYIVVNNEAGRTASHCYAYSGICGPSFTTTYQTSGSQWSLGSNLDWLRNKL
eukprot:376943_1